MRSLVSRFPFMPWNDVGSQFLTLDHQDSRSFQPSFPTFYVMSHILIPFIKSHGIPGLVASIKRGCWFGAHRRDRVLVSKNAVPVGMWFISLGPTQEDRTSGLYRTRQRPVASVLTLLISWPVP